MRLNRLVKGVLALFAVALAAVAIGCGNDDSNGSDSGSSGSSNSDLTFAMVTHGDAGSFWTVVKNGAQQAADDLGVTLKYSESVNDPQKQAQMIDAAISDKVDGLAVSGPDPDAIRNSLKKADKAGIPIIVLNAGTQLVDEVGALEFVGQEESIAGEAVGERVKDEGATKVLCVIHEQGNVSLEDRCNGVKKGFGGDVETMQVKGTADIATSLTEMQSKLQADKSIDFVVTLNGEIADAAVDSVKGASSDAKIGTFDLSGPVVQAIQDGEIEFAVDQQQYLQGYLPVTFLKLYADNQNTVGGGLPVLTGPSFVTKENAAAVAKLAEEGTR